jgi:hypothetical protein
MNTAHERHAFRVLSYLGFVPRIAPVGTRLRKAAATEDGGDFAFSAAIPGSRLRRAPE